MKKFFLGLMLGLLFCASGFSAVAPTIVSASANSSLTQLTVNGSGFSPNNTTPTVVLGGITLSIVSASDTTVVAALPANEPSGSYALSVTETSTGSKTTTFGVTIGAVGPQGPVGPQGNTGPTGPQGPSVFAGTWSSSGVYSVGQEVLRPSDGGSPGPFFNLTGSNSGDPVTDTTNWIYCCGIAHPVTQVFPILNAAF